MEEAVSDDAPNPREQIPGVEVGGVSDERMRIVARVLAKVLVAKALIDLGASNKSSSSGVR